MAESAALRGADWLIGQMQPDGSLREATSINEYYKAVIGLAVAGRPIASERMLDYVAKRFLNDDGDLDGSGCEWFEQYRIYPHAWLLMAAVVNARFDLVRKLAAFLERFQDRDNGGFYGTTAQLRCQGEQELMTTGVVAIALLWAGRADAALLTGHWLRRLFEAQPDLAAGLYFVWKKQRGLVTDFDAKDALNYQVNAQTTGQYYFQYGVAAALLSALAGATGDSTWLDLAKAYLAATRHCLEDVLLQPASGKIGWGAAWTYRMSGDPECRALANTVNENLCRAQHQDGWWSAANFYQREATPSDKPGMDLTGEFVALLGWMDRAGSG